MLLVCARAAPALARKRAPVLRPYMVERRVFLHSILQVARHKVGVIIRLQPSARKELNTPRVARTEQKQPIA